MRSPLNVEKAKDKARRLELKGQVDKAISQYVKILEDLEGTPELGDELALFNKVGDLYLKRGDVPSAVHQYEKAIDLYADQGFPNNAIALCNKVLRNAPGRTHVYLKLAKLMLQRGFVAESKQNLLEYAERMQKAGQVEEAFHALKEFADLSPDNEEIRLMLAEQLQRAARTEEAREQLAKLYQEVSQSGDERRTRRTLDRMKAIDPDLALDLPVPAKQESKKQKTTDIVFINLDDDAPAATEPAPPETAPPADEPLNVEATSMGAEDDTAPSPAVDVGFSVERTGEDAMARSSSLDVAPLDGLEIATPFEVPTDTGPGELDLEPTALDELPPPAFDESAEDEDLLAVDEPDEFLEEPEELPSLGGVSISFDDGDTADSADGMADYIGEIPAVAFEPPDAAALGHEPDLEELETSPGVDETELAGPAAWSPSARLTDEGVISEAGVEVPELDMGDVPSLEDSLEWDGLAGTEQDETPGDPLAELPLLDADEDEDDEGLGEIAVSTLPDVGAPDISTLESLIAEDPDAPGPHRELGEALLEIGERERGLQELDLALEAYEMQGDAQHARDVADEILRLTPNSVHHHQKRVEIAYRVGDRGKLTLACLELGDALVRVDDVDEARAVYERVLEQDPGNGRALSALTALGPSAPAADVVDEAEEEVPDEDEGAVTVGEIPSAAPADVTPASPPPAERRKSVVDFVDLGALILEEEEPVRDTRMRIEEEEPSGDEERDFREMLSEFKKGIDANIAVDDSQAHYDLGVAFKEMGLLDEAISEFQKALRGADGRLRTAEALGLCFYEKGQYAVSATVLRRAIDSEPGGDDAKIGLLYWLARCEEEQNHQAQALEYYQRIFSIDIDFHDVKERVNSLAQAGN